MLRRQRAVRAFPARSSGACLCVFHGCFLCVVQAPCSHSVLSRHIIIYFKKRTPGACDLRKNEFGQCFLLYPIQFYWDCTTKQSPD